MSFSSYASLAQRLDALRRGEQARAAGQKEELESGRAGLDELVNRLTEQQTALHQAARELRFRMPRVDPAPSAAPTPRDALAAGNAAADTSDRERELAVLRAQGPVVLPTWKTAPRNAVIYGACAGAALILQWILIAVSDDKITEAAWSLCGLPMIAFFIGYSLVGILGVPRIPPKPAEGQGRVLRSKPEQPKVDRTPRLGFIICIAALPTSWVFAQLL